MTKKLTVVAVATFMVIGLCVLWSSPFAWRAIAKARGTYDIIRFDHIHAPDGGNHQDPEIPEGKDYAESPAYDDEAETYDGNTWYIVRQHMTVRRYRVGVPFEHGGRTNTEGGSIIYHTRESFVGNAEKLHPFMVRRILAWRKMDEYGDTHGWKDTPELRTLMRKAGMGGETNSLLKELVWPQEPGAAPGATADTNATAKGADVTRIRNLTETELGKDADKVLALLTDETGKALCEKVTGAESAMAKLEAEYAAASGDNGKRKEIAQQYAALVREVVNAYNDTYGRITAPLRDMSWKLDYMESEAPDAFAANKGAFRKVAERFTKILASLQPPIQSIKGLLDTTNKALKVKETAGEERTEELVLATLVEESTKLLESKSRNDSTK